MNVNLIIMTCLVIKELSFHEIKELLCLNWQLNYKVQASDSTLY